jgi:hypothetical protein
VRSVTSLITESSMSNNWAVYDEALQNVADKNHEIVYRFQFKKLEQKDGQQWWNRRDLVTGQDQKFAYKDASKNPRFIFRSSNKLIWADSLDLLTPSEIPSSYDLNLKLVEDRKHELVYRYQFKMLEQGADGLQWWNMRDLMKTNGGDQRIAEKDPTTSYRNRNHLIWADTLLRPTQEELANDDDENPADVPAPASGSTSGGVKRQINRDYSVKQKHAILNEVVFGNHKNLKGIKISPFRRNDHGNNGHFFKSVVAALNSQADGPFIKARAVQDTVKTFVETAVDARRQVLEKTYGLDYMKRLDWDVYDHSDDDDKQSSCSMQCGIDENLDALVYNAFSAAESLSNKVDSSKPTAAVYTEEDDQSQADQANGNAPKKPRYEHKVEKVRGTPQSAVAQLSMQQHSISEMMKSITALISAPVLSAAPFQSPPTPAVPFFDEELLPLLESLKNLPEAPGTTAVCKTLASSLGNYGITSIQELRNMEKPEAEKILTGLMWTPLQIQKVLNPKV